MSNTRQHFRLARPLRGYRGEEFWRQATCAEVDCRHYLQGWQTTVPATSIQADEHQPTLDVLRVGDTDLCDYQDFVVENGNETNRLAFFKGGLYGGAGDYDRFLRGITLALESGIKIAFNRVLFKEHTDDLPEQLAFVERRKSRLKLYTLMWTPQSAATHEKFYQDWRPVVRTTVLPRTVEIVRVRKQVGRGRLRFNLIGGDSVEVKLGDKLDRSAYPCSSCSFKNECEEGFGDYVRVDPRLHLYFCYMRRDIGFQIPEYFGRPKELKQKIGEVFGNTDIVRLLATTPLRLTVTPFCNFNCRSPGAVEGWCMEEPGEYIYPKIRPTLLGKEI